MKLAIDYLKYLIWSLFFFHSLALAEDTSGKQNSEVKQPSGNWQVPKDFQKPRDVWQKPLEFQVPKGLQAIKIDESKACEASLVVRGDALFEFDKATLSPESVETLRELGPVMAKHQAKSVVIEGHTDGKGSDAYNDRLSEARAWTVSTWLKEKGFLNIPFEIKGYGKRRPIAPNTKSDGRDFPEGRRENRRVELKLSTCK